MFPYFSHRGVDPICPQGLAAVMVVIVVAGKSAPYYYQFLQMIDTKKNGKKVTIPQIGSKMRVDPKIWRAVMQRDRWRCRYCDGDLLASLVTYDAATVDHIIPVSIGGSDDESNLVASCSGCNSRLSRSKLPSFEERKAFLSEKTKTALADLATWQNDLRKGRQ